MKMISVLTEKGKTMRLIDADVLIDALGISDEDIVFKEILEDAPTIDAAPRWIPCSERLPEYLNYVLLSSSEYGLKIGARTRKSNFDSWYINEPLDCDVWHVIGSNCMYDFEDFTAWMPLPEPYGGERKDND